MQQERHGLVEGNTAMRSVLAMVREIKETSDINEVVRLLQGDKWIAIAAVYTEPNKPMFAMGRVSD